MSTDKWTEEEQDRAVRIMQVVAAAFFLAQITSMGKPPSEEQFTMGMEMLCSSFSNSWNGPDEAKDDIVAFALQVGVGAKAILLPTEEVGKPKS